MEAVYMHVQPSLGKLNGGSGGGWLVVALGVMMYVEGDNNYR